MKIIRFYLFDSDPRFPPFLLYVRWKSGVTFVRRCFCDVGENAHTSWTAWYDWFKFCMLMCFNIVSHWDEKMWQGFTEHHFGRSCSFGENVHTSWTAWYICSNFVYYVMLTLSNRWYCKTVTRLHRASFWPVKLFGENAHTSWTVMCIWFKLWILMYFNAHNLSQIVYLVHILYTCVF